MLILGYFKSKKTPVDFFNTVIRKLENIAHNPRTQHRKGCFMQNMGFKNLPPNCESFNLVMVTYPSLQISGKLSRHPFMSSIGIETSGSRSPDWTAVAGGARSLDWTGATEARSPDWTWSAGACSPV